MTSHGVQGVEGYAIDNPFIFKLRQACKKKETLDAWMEEWVLSCADPFRLPREIGGGSVEKPEG